MNNIELDIIYRCIDGTATKQERDEYELWLEQSGEHQKYAKQIENYYERGAVYKSKPINMLDKRFEEFKSNVYHNNKRSLIYRAIGVVAVLIVGMFLTTTFFSEPKVEIIESKVDQVVDNKVVLAVESGDVFEIDIAKTEDIEAIVGEAFIDYSQTKYGKSELHTLRVPQGRTWRVILADGTEVLLNANSELSYPNSFDGASERIVALKGEAFFNVKHNEKSRFIVNTDGVDIRVHGTQFNVNCYDKDAIETVLAEGSVSLRVVQSNEEMFITPNQRAVCIKGKQLNVDKVVADDYLLWTKGILYFNELILGEIIKHLSNVYNFKYEFDNEEIKDVSIYCRIPRPESVEDVLKVLSLSGKFKYTVDGSNILIW